MKSTVSLENYDQARLLASEGMGLLSVSGVRLAFKALKAKDTNNWPIEVVMSTNGITRALENMAVEADRLEDYRLSPPTDLVDAPDFPGNEAPLRATIAAITGQVQTV